MLYYISILEKSKEVNYRTRGEPFLNTHSYKFGKPLLPFLPKNWHIHRKLVEEVMFEETNKKTNKQTQNTTGVIF